jgi:hypothetical protein
LSGRCTHRIEAGTALTINLVSAAMIARPAVLLTFAPTDDP